MTDTLTARLLAEIERREKVSGKPSRFGGPLAPEVLAYLAALRTVVAIHTDNADPETEYWWIESAHACRTCGEPREYGEASYGVPFPCPTLLAVAEGLGVEVE